MAPIVVRKKYIVAFLIVLVVFLPFIAIIKPMMPAECIFCKIIQGKIPETKIEMETEDFVVFADIKPESTYHYLAVPKRHIESLKSLTAADENLIDSMSSGLKKVLSDKQIDENDALFGFHMPPFTSVKHLHMHGIAPQSSMSFISRLVFRPHTLWFKTVADAKQYLQEKPL